MTSYLKGAYKLGRDVYAAVDEARKEHSAQKLHQAHGYHNGAQGGQYPQAHAPPQYGPSGQVQQPPSLPPRPNPQPSQAPSYTTPQGGYMAPQGYHANSSVPTASPAYSQAAHVASNPVHAQNSPGNPYTQHGQNPPGTSQPITSLPPQTSGTIPATHAPAAPQSSWQTAASYPITPTPHLSSSQPLSAWEIAGGARPPQPSVPSTQAWTPVPPPPATVSPLHATGPYSPPAPSYSSHHAFPQPQIPNGHSPPAAAQQYPQQHSPSYTSATPPMSPPLPSPSLFQPHAHSQQYPPTSPAMPPTAYQQPPYLYGNQGLTSPTSSTVYQGQVPPPAHPSPPPHVQSPVSPSASFSSAMPDPPAFVSELPAEPAKPKPIQLAPAVQHISPSLPEGYAELPAELPSEPVVKTSPSSSTIQTQPASELNGHEVEVPRPLFSSPKPSQSPTPPAAYAPLQYTPAQSTSASPAPINYQPYHAQVAAENSGHASLPPTKQQAVPQHDNGYKPYAPQAQPPAPYQAMPASGPPQQTTNPPQRVGSLANKFSSVSLNAQHGQYVPYSGA